MIEILESRRMMSVVPFLGTPTAQSAAPATPVLTANLNPQPLPPGAIRALNFRGPLGPVFLNPQPLPP